MLKTQTDLAGMLNLPEPRDAKTPTVSFTEKQEEWFKEHYQQYVELWKLRFDAKYASKHGNRMHIDCPSALPLVEWFEMKSKSVADTTFLFKDIKRVSVYGSFFQKWSVDLTSSVPMKKLKTEEESIVIDLQDTDDEEDAGGNVMHIDYPGSGKATDEGIEDVKECSLKMYVFISHQRQQLVFFGSYL
jgi:hypothetical protein